MWQVTYDTILKKYVIKMQKKNFKKMLEIYNNKKPYPLCRTPSPPFGLYTFFRLINRPGVAGAVL